MGQIIKSLCVCLFVCQCIRLWALSRSHFLIDFHQKAQTYKPPKVKTSSFGVISHHSFPHFLPKPPF